MSEPPVSTPPLPPANLLGREKSPYLLQHAANPVHWRPWGAAALAEAVALDRPILLSIGYAACHWCHVMAHESFEDAATAAEMNRLFVNIKVDREERPDIDHIYMSALQAMGQQGGWPLTMFLTPAGQPFWGGTYFPPQPRWGMPSFRQVLEAVARAYRERDQAVLQNTEALARALRAMSATQPGQGIAPQTLDRIGQGLLALVDFERGGLRGAPKFPNAPIFRFFAQEAARSGAPAFRQALDLLLRRMSLGGIYDHLGGGYARYSTDAEWLVPHFEKMLYDNGQILELLALAAAATPDPLFADRAAETVGWLQRDMATEGAFAASEDADSEGEEGRFYVWTRAEIATLLGDAAPLFERAYDVTEAGNWEGRTILRRVVPPLPEAEERRLAAARATLLAARGRRVRPGRDDKILADWNALAVIGLARAAFTFHRPDWLQRAVATHDAVHRLLGRDDGRVDHAWRDGTRTAAGLLEDQALMAAAALLLFQGTGQPRFLAAATRLAEAALRFFADADGSFYTAASDAADLPAGRPRSAADGPVPNGNGVMAQVMATLWHLTGEPEWRRRAEAVLRAFSGAGDQLAAMPGLLAAADLLENATVAVILGEGEAAAALAAAALASDDPARLVLLCGNTAGLAAAHPAHGKTLQAGAAAAAFVCRGGTCALPVTTTAALAAALRRAPPPAQS